jgi:hypothetical protein
VTHRPAESCAACGRRIEGEQDRDQVRYCCVACGRHAVDDSDRRLEQSILELLTERAATATICPSEAARVVGGDGWRELMEPGRRAARRLVASGQVQITQQGRVVDSSTARGPIRIRRTR